MHLRRNVYKTIYIRRSYIISAVSYICIFPTFLFSSFISHLCAYVTTVSYVENRFVFVAEKCDLYSHIVQAQLDRFG